MATGGTFDVKFTADSSDLRSELEKVSKSLDNVADATSGATNDLRKGLDDAKNSAGNLAKKIPSVGTAAKPVNDKLRQTGQNAHTAADGLGDFERSAGNAGAVASGLAGALGIVSPKLAAMGQAFAAAAGGLEAVGRSGTRLFAVLGPVAAAVAVAGAAYVHFRGELDLANAALETQRSKLEAVQDMHRKVKEAVLLSALANDEITQTEFDSMAAAQSATDLTRDRRDALKEERDALDQKRMALEKVTAAANAMADSDWIDVDDVDELNSQSAALAELNRKLALNQTQTDTLTATEKRFTQALLDSKKTIETKSAASTKAADVETEQADERLAALEQLGQIFDEQTARKLVDYDLLEENAAREIEIIGEIMTAHLDSEAVIVAAIEANQAVRARLARDMFALDKKFEEKSDAARQLYHEKEKARKQELVRVTMSANTELAGSTADLFMAMSTVTSEHDKKTALIMFNIWKGLSLAHIGLKTAEGMMTAAALPPPADVIKGAAVFAAAGASTLIVATTKAPFHAGSSFVRAPDRTSELNARLRAGEAVSTPLGAEILGRDNIAAANAGIGNGGGNAPIVFQYEHRAFTRFIRDNVRAVSGGLSDEINSGRTIGQRGIGR